MEQDPWQLTDHLRESLQWRRRIKAGLDWAIALCLVAMLASVVMARPMHRPAVDPTPTPAFKVEVIAHLWWWEFRYPGTSIITADEMHVPAKRSIDLVLKTGDDPDILASPEVVHGFYLPQLEVLRFAVPGQISHVQFQSGAPAVYHGRCAEYCGLGHSKMRFLVFVDSADKFAAWERNQQRIPMPPSGNGPVAKGERTFANGLCTTCHMIRGISKGTLGPNLTHLGSRTTIVSATMENTPANLKKWIEDPGNVKRGVHMPPLGLRGKQLDDLVAYLESLK